MNSAELRKQENDQLYSGQSGSAPLAREATMSSEFDPIEIVRHNFTNREHLIERSVLSTLDCINLRFAGNLEVSFAKLLHRTPKIEASTVQLLKFLDLMDEKDAHVSVNVLAIHPLNGRAMLSLDANLVGMAVDRFYGGLGRFVLNSGIRKFSYLEQRIIKRIVEFAVVDYNAAWSTVMPGETEWQSIATSTKFDSIVGAEELVLTVTFVVTVGESVGEMTLMVPYSMIEPVRNLLELDSSFKYESAEPDHNLWQGVLKELLTEVPLQLHCYYGQTQMLFSEVLKLKKGDVIPLEDPGLMTLICKGTPLFTASEHPSANGQRVVKVEEKIGG